MSDCEVLRFTDFTSERFERAVQKAAANGIVITGNSGQASKTGFTMTWNYDPVGQVLELQCLNKPFFISCATVNNKIRAFADKFP